MAVHKVRGLQYLVAVVDEGGFNAAARRLGVSAPSVHRLVHALEAELGVTLLDRSSQPLQPTSHAVAYVERARALLSDLRELDASLQDQSQAPRGTLVLAAHSIALQFVLAQALPGFHARFPEVHIDLVDAGKSRDLVKLGADALVQFGWPPEQDAILRTLAETRWLIVATPGYWARHGVPAHPSALARLPCALFQTPFGEVTRNWHFERNGELVQVAVDGWLTSDSRVALDAPLYAGQLASRINDLTAHPGMVDGTLQPVLLDWTGPNSPPLSMLVRRSLARQPRMRVWIDFMVDLAGRLTANRLPAGLPPVEPSLRPEWWRRRVVGGQTRSRRT
ncbi:MAG TPA: LysR family transcriptional regulator [Methylibium sp.]|nr:LysR family transcriptional regulator [Methylibium sp.]